MVYSLYPPLSDLSKILSFIFHMYLTALMIFSCHKSSVNSFLTAKTMALRVGDDKTKVTSPTDY